MASLSSIPEELKFINPYLQRAQETRKREPVISYYCNFLAAKLALEKGTKSKESKPFLAKLLDMLEQEKKGLADNEAITNDIAGEAYVENFSLKVFTVADNEDRAGKATRGTAKTFLAASIYMELLKIFGNINPEFEGKIKYAKWKAVDIMKALKEGRTPVPGPPGGEPTLQQPGFEENGQSFPGVDQLPLAQPTGLTTAGLTTAGPTTTGPITGPITGPTTISTGPSPSSDNNDAFDAFQLFPPAPTHNNSVPNVQDLVSSFDQIDIGKQVAPPLPPKVVDYAGNNNNNNIFDNQTPAPAPASAPSPKFSPPSSANFYDVHQQNYQQPPPSQPPLPQPPPLQPSLPQSPSSQPPSTLPHTGFTNDYAQPHHYQLPQPPHNPLLSPAQVSSQNYVQPVNPSLHQQPSFSVPVSNHQNYSMHSYSQPPPAEIDPTTVETVQKYCKFANSALDYNDVNTAVDYLNKALESLKPYSK